MTWSRASLLALVMFAGLAHADAPLVLKGRLEGYRGIYPFHVFALRSPDFGAADAIVAQGTADAETGRFDLPLPATVGDGGVYLFGQLDFGRQGPTLIGQQVFPLRKLPFLSEELRGVRHLFDLGDMELANVVREAKTSSAVGIALGLALLLYGIGIVWARRLPRCPRPALPPPPRPGALVWTLALGSTAWLLWRLGTEPVALLEFTYIQEALRPTSVVALLTDPISAELSHPPLWPLILRSLSAVSRSEWLLRLPSVLAHVPLVLLVFQLGVAHGSRRVGVLAAAFAAFLPLGVWYARDATPYSLLALVAAAAAWFAVRERWRAFAATLVAGFFLHYTVAVLGIFLGVALFLESRRTGDQARFRRALVGFAWVLPLPLVWSVHFIATFLASGASTRLMAVDYNPDPGLPAYVTQIGSVVLGLPQSLPAPVVSAGLVIVLVVLLGGLWTLWRHSTDSMGDPESRSAFLGRFAAFSAAAVVLYTLFVHQMYMAFAAGRVYYGYRWASVFIPGVALALAAGLETITRGRRWPQVALGGAWLTGALLQTATIVHGAQRPAQWDALGRIHAERAPGDAYCALPAVYFAQMTNYVLWNRHPEDLLGMPRWEPQGESAEGLYGPIHPVNTTLETVVQNLAFERVWVIAYAEEAFGTPEFDLATTDHHLAWMAEHLIPDGEWRYPFLQLYRFRVPTAPERLWEKTGEGVWTASLDFSKTIHNFRYFPKFLHSQETGLSMSRSEVVVRVPAPPGAATLERRTVERRTVERLTVEVEMAFGQPAIADDLALAGQTPDAWAATGFRTTQDGGVWSGTLPVGSAERLDLSLKRSERAAAAHRNTVIRLRSEASRASP